MNITLKVWRQSGPEAEGAFHEYTVHGVSEDSSFLEMLDILNEELFARGEDPIAFDSDCREGICGMCGVVINGVPHYNHAPGTKDNATTCQLHMRKFHDGDHITVEPWRSTAFPIIKDLVVNRRALDRIIQAGGYISVNTGSAPDAHATPVPKDDADRAFDAATCIGCGACVAACPNGSAMLFTSAKITHLGLLPQGKPENLRRVTAMLNQMDAEGFGGCTNYGECSAVCPKGISLDCIAILNRQLGKAVLKGVKTH